ncbi:MAG: hypothetical protein NDI94_03720 [Candidatus Woesearchaeota archaeon]|nr:hypothetical protein [Candidatus Woesearchaeota archaeon]
MKEGFFVGIYEPIDVRRNILESSKEIVKSMQAQERLLEIRREKLVQYDKIRSVMDELSMLLAKLKQKLPESHLRKATGEMPIKTLTDPRSGEMRKLEQEFRKIEQEFSNLS